MLNYKLLISYDGAKYKGWQKQGNNANTIQGKLEETLSKLLNQAIEVHGSGRTDAGVNAIGQVANFHFDETICSMTPEELIKALNNYLPKDIRINEVKAASDRFHARLNALSKTYEYRIDNSEFGNLWERKHLLRIDEPLDLQAMKEAAKYFLGTHDFKCFSTNSHKKKSTVRHIFDIDIEEKDSIIYLRFTGNGFLYNMVRIMANTLIEAGLHRIEPADITALFEAGDRQKTPSPAAPEALFLIEVNY